MPSTHTPSVSCEFVDVAAISRPNARGQRRIGSAVGHLVATAVNLVLLWIAHHLLEWDWPRFLTDGFDELLPLVSLSLGASAVAELIFVVHDGGRFRPFADLVTATISLALAWRTWQVYPFDFSTYAHDWSWLATTMVWLGIVGTAIAVVANLAKLGRRLDAPDGS